MIDLDCKICGREFSRGQLLCHHLRSHKIKAKDYYDKYFKTEGEDICVVCGGLTKFRNMTLLYAKHCSNKCTANDRTIRVKTIKTCVEKYGAENPHQVDIVKNKTKHTCLQKYGVENPQQNQNVKKKTENTCHDKYGTDCVFQSDIIKNKIKSTCLQKYGVENPQQNYEVRKKTIETHKKHHGVEFPLQSERIKSKYQNTSILKFGEDHYMKTIDGREVARRNFIKMIEKQKLNGEPLSPRVGIKERPCLDELSNLIPNTILRQKKLFSYFPDGYVPELNLVIEFDESFHDQPWCQKRDKIKYETYERHNINIFRINEHEWETDKDMVKKNFIELCRKLS